jgi:hypothetical protein
MERIFLLLTLPLFSLLISSCDKNNDETDDWIEWNQPNENHRIVGGWRLEVMEIIACESDNRTAVDMIYNQYKSRMGNILAFGESGYYTTSGSFHEIAGKYRLVDNQLYFSKDMMVRITLDENSFSYESDYTDGFQWYLNTPFMSAYKDASIHKIVIKEVYKKIIHGD